MTIAEIDLAEEALRGGLVLGHDAIGVMRPVGLDVLDRRLQTVDDAQSDDRVEIFGPPIVFARRRHARVGLAGGRIAAHRAARLDQRLDQGLQHERRGGAVDEQRFGGAADAGPPHLSVDRDA